MFKIGDTVKPKKGLIGDDYCFKITNIELRPFSKNLYKLQRIEQELDLKYNSISTQLNIINAVEFRDWEEDEIELTSNVKLRYAETDINIPVYNHVILDEMVEELTKQNKTNKEENKMQILEIYKERKIKAIEKEYLEAKEMTRKDDEIQKIIIEMTNQVNTILENQGTTAIYEFNPSLVTAKTQERFELLEKGKDKEIEELRSTLEEIRALFEMTDDYHERIKILKDYDILNKKGKLNI